jgi:hypothetical protein
VENSYTPPNATATIVGPVSCAPNGAASAVSTATADFVAPGQRVVQAVSFYCPANPVPHSALCKVGGSLSDNGEEAVTMQQFIAYLRAGGGDLGSSWNAATSGRYKIVKDASGNIIQNYRYVQTPQNPGVIIDMRHFQYVGPLGQGVGGIVEACQAMGGQASAYQRQDFYSNALGEAFASYHNATGNGDYATALQNFFLGNINFRRPERTEHEQHAADQQYHPVREQHAVTRQLNPRGRNPTSRSASSTIGSAIAAARRAHPSLQYPRRYGRARPAALGARDRRQMRSPAARPALRSARRRCHQIARLRPLGQPGHIAGSGSGSVFARRIFSAMVSASSVRLMRL